MNQVVLFGIAMILSGSALSAEPEVVKLGIKYQEVAIALAEARASVPSMDVSQDEILQAVEKAVSFDARWELGLGTKAVCQSNPAMISQMGDVLSYRLSLEGRLINNFMKAKELTGYLAGSALFAPNRGATGSKTVRFNADFTALRTVVDIDNRETQTKGFWRLEDRKINGYDRVVLVTNFAGKRAEFFMTFNIGSMRIRFISVTEATAYDKASEDYEPANVLDSTRDEFDA